MTLPDNYARATAALQMITRLTQEKQSLMSRAMHTPLQERAALQHRLQQVERELAHAQDERRRALAGAPPAPVGYDPLGPLSRVETSKDDKPRSRSWKHKMEAIRADYQQGEGMGRQALAEKYDLSLQQIEQVLREKTRRGHPTAKLNEAQVRDILHRYRESNGRRGIIKELADSFQVRKSTICDIISRRTWRNIDAEGEASGTADKHDNAPLQAHRQN
jgi:Mor family transcriptional regulator